jgi:hypothetical protein
MGSAPLARTEEHVMTPRKTMIRAAVGALFVLAVAALGLPWSSAQGPTTFNEREVKTSGTLQDDPKSDVWTLDFRFKDPRLIKVNIPGRGNRICWYMWYQVINRTKEPRTFYPEFELVTLDFPGTYVDDMLTTVEDAIKKIEDPTGYQEIKNSTTISANPIPVSLAPDKAFPKAVTGVAIWDGTAADPKERDPKKRDLSDSQRFSVFVGGLSNGLVLVDPLTKGKADQPVIRRKTLQLNFKRVGDRFNLDARDITFEAPYEWIYRPSRLGRPKEAKDGKEGKDAKDAKGDVLLWPAVAPLADIREYQLQPTLYRGEHHGS